MELLTVCFPVKPTTWSPQLVLMHPCRKLGETISPHTCSGGPVQRPRKPLTLPPPYIKQVVDERAASSQREKGTQFTAVRPFPVVAREAHRTNDSSSCT
ncbi:hypothetical protein GN956_G5861 [Arapaima gigas]